MSSSQLKDATRNIWKNFVSYISILLITMLSIATYMGVSSASANLENGANDFYRDSNFYDLEIVSTLLLSEDDVNAIKDLDSVDSVVPFYFTNASCENNKEKQNVNITSIIDGVCVPSIKEGDYPKAENECMIEDRLAESMSYKVGDKITLFGNEGEEVPYLINDTFTITGIYQTPLHIKPSVKENSYVIINESAFDLDKLKGCYMRAYVRIKCNDDINIFSDEYSKKVKKVKSEIEALATDRTAIRDAEIKDMYQSQIDEYQELLDESKQKLEAADASLTDAEKEINTGKAKLDKSSKDLKDLKSTLEEGRKKLDSSKVELDSGKSTLDSSKKTLDDARATLDDKNRQLSEAKRQLDYYDNELSGYEAQLSEAEQTLETAKAELEKADKDLAKGKSDLEEYFYEAESIKTEARKKIKNIINKVMEIAGIDVEINWASEVTDVDVETAVIEDFYITDSFKIDLLNDDISSVVERLMTNLNLEQYYDKDRFDEIKAKVAAFLETVVPQIDSIKNKINDNRGKLSKWNESRDYYVKALKEYNKKKAEYESKYSEYESSKQTIESKREAWRGQKKSYESGMAAYESAESEYQSGLSTYETYKAKWEEKNKQYQDGLAKYNQGLASYDEYSAEYDKGLKKLADYESEFEEKKKEYEDGVVKYEDGQKTLDSMKEELDKLGECKWIATTVDANVGYKHMGMTVDSLQNLGNNFTILFVLLASLIIYATIARIISEQHKLVGTTKAFGFYVREILSKYLIFAMSALFVGLVIGTVVSIGFEKFALSTFVKNYVIDTPPAKPVASVVIIVVVVASIITLAAVLFATTSLLRQPAVELLRESSPKGVKGETNGNHILSLFQRLILRNIVSDKTRVIVTIASIASCCALINIGFTMKYDIAKTEVIEYVDRLQYDYNIIYDNDDTESSIQEVEDILKKNNCEYANSMSYYSTFKTGDGSEIVEMTVTDMEIVQDFYKFTTPKKHKKLKLTKDGVYIKAGYADAYGIKIGDPITIMNNRGVEGQAVVAGVFENYTGQKLYMDSEYYKTVFDEEPAFNRCMVKCTPDVKDALVSELNNNPHVHLVEKSDAEREFFTSYAKSLNALLILILVAAILMAAIIISNLTFMYVMQKKVEIIIMRINGYSFNEVRTYLLRESIFSTLIGILIGLGGGAYLASSIIKSFEKPHLQLYRGINLKAWIMAALVTIIFTLVIDALALRKVRHMQMTDIANVK